jgi:hypothetical protein
MLPAGLDQAVTPVTMLGLELPSARNVESVVVIEVPSDAATFHMALSKWLLVERDYLETAFIGGRALSRPCRDSVGRAGSSR